MMLVESDLKSDTREHRVPLRDACEHVTTDSAATAIRLTADASRNPGTAEPRMWVAGLNPHTGDGDDDDADEEAAEVEPALERVRPDGIDVSGPESPDTVHIRATVVRLRGLDVPRPWSHPDQGARVRQR